MKRFLYWLLGLRLVVLWIRAFLPFGLPEIWRQVDTMGVALRYWNRWTAPLSDPHPLLPAILNSGDTSGIMAMEFPFLNLLTAPCFALGPYWGRRVALLVFFTVIVGLTLWNARLWRKKSIRGVDAETAMLLLPLISLGAEWSGKFMPDYLSLLFVLMAMALSWDNPRRTTSFLLATLGLLMKPTTVCALFLMGFAPSLRNERKRTLQWVTLSGLLAFLYYKYGVAYLHHFQEMPARFAIEMRNPISSLREFLLQPASIAQFLATAAFCPFGIFFIVPYVLWERYRKKKYVYGVLWALIPLQILPIAAAAGTHALSHRYYFLSLTPTFAFLFLSVIQNHPPRWLKGLLWASVVLQLVQLSQMDLRSLFRDEMHRDAVADGECRVLRHRHPEIPWGKDEPFRSSSEEFPQLGLCFGEREGSSKAGYGFYWASDSTPPGCVAIDSTAVLKLVSCPIAR